MPIANLSRTSLHYELEGPQGAPVVVLSNSLGTELGMWDRQAVELSRRFRVLRYDTRGHGSTRADGDAYSLSDLGGDVLELLDALGIDRAHVCGVSLGGLTALWLAVEAPQRILSVMACNTAARIGTAAGWNERIAQVKAHGLASLADTTMERWFTPAFRDTNATVVERTRQMLLSTSAQGYMACCAALREADLRDAVRSISVPTLVISGTYDPVTPPTDGQFLRAAIPRARYQELNAAHLSNVEQPETFLGAMGTFLSAMDQG